MGKWRALYCIESPEVIFIEFISHVSKGGEKRVEIDPLFVDACEPGTLRLLSVESEDFGMGLISGRARSGVVELNRALGHGEVVNLMVTGTRKGFTGIRFTESTEEEAKRNAAKWV
jgi:hypothetical protein